jgi:apolipoprotein N-acyltransferase
VALLQGAVPQELKLLPEQLPVTAELYRGLTVQAQGSDLIVWPEAAILDLYENVRAYLDEIEQQATAAGSTVMLGILRYHAATATAYNSVVTLGRSDQFYDKRHLVPYGEYFPLPQVVKRWLRRMNVPANDLTPGDPNQAPLVLLGERFAFAICYEDVFGAEQLGALPEATVLVNVSNDAWFGESIAAPQHLQIARMRAAEVGRYLLRSTNTGITAVIDPRGRIVDRLPRFETGVLRAEFRGHTGATPYVSWGNYAVLLLVLAILLAQFAMTKLTIRPGT